MLGRHINSSATNWLTLPCLAKHRELATGQDAIKIRGFPCRTGPYKLAIRASHVTIHVRSSATMPQVAEHGAVLSEVSVRTSCAAISSQSPSSSPRPPPAGK